MSLALASIVIVTLGTLLVVVSVAVGALWWRLRSWPSVEVARLAADLHERQRALEGLLARFEREGAKPEAADPPEPGAPRRVDRPKGPVGSGPTLITVPDLGASRTPDPSAASELGRRFGSIWDLAEAGVPADVIARRTGQPIGRVELILGLRRGLAAAEGRA